MSTVLCRFVGLLIAWGVGLAQAGGDTYSYARIASGPIDGDLLERLQLRLKEGGYHTGEINGVWDRPTYKAFAAFRKKHKLREPEAGDQFDTEVLSKLLAQSLPSDDVAEARALLEKAFDLPPRPCRTIFLVLGRRSTACPSNWTEDRLNEYLNSRNNLRSSPLKTPVATPVQLKEIANCKKEGAGELECISRVVY